MDKDEVSQVLREMAFFIELVDDSINPDAHSSSQLDHCRFGVNIARKGWIIKENVINTLNLKEMIQFLKKRKP